MEFQKYLDPFGVERAARDEESQISARNVRSSVDLFNMQQQMDQMRNRRAMLQEMAQSDQQPKAQPGQPPQQEKPSASDMILGELGKIDKGIGLAAKYGQLDEQDKLIKLREQAMGRYSLAKDRETQATDRMDKMRKEANAAVARFAAGTTEILNDDKLSPEDKRQELEEREAVIREENPQAYRQLAAGQQSINWADPRTWNRMKSLAIDAIPPEKRTELAIRQQDERRKEDALKEQRHRDETRDRQVDAMIAHMREGEKRRDEPKLTPGMRWVDAEHTAMEPVPIKNAASSIAKDVHGEEYLKQLPEDEQGLIRGIAEGRINPATLSTRGGHREAILKQVAQYKPDYNQAKYAIYAAVQKDFTSGTASRNVTAINTAIHHMGTMEALGEALKNKDTQAINRVTNAVATQLGDPRINNFEIAASAVSNELMRVFRQVGASTTEIQDWEKKFKGAQSPEQIREGIQTAAKLLRGRIEAVDEQWKRGMDSKEGYPDLLSPKSQRVLEKIGVKVRDDPEKPAKKGGAPSLEDYIKSQEGK